MDCTLTGSSVHGIFLARILEWVAVSFSRWSSQTKNRTQVSCVAGRFFTKWTTREALALEIPPKSLEVVLLKGEAAWKINSYQISMDNARTPEAFRATPCCQLSCAVWILMQLDSLCGHWALLGRPSHLQPFEVRLCLFLSHGWWGLSAQQAVPHQGAVGACEISSRDREWNLVLQQRQLQIKCTPGSAIVTEALSPSSVDLVYIWVLTYILLCV